jgi:hypothetical protein
LRDIGPIILVTVICQQLSPANLPRARKPDNLSNPAQDRDERIAAIIDSNLVQSRLLKVYRAVGCCHFEQLSRRERSYIEYAGAVPQRQLRSPLGQRENFERSIRVQPSIIAPAESDCGVGFILDINARTDRNRSVDRGLSPIGISLVLAIGLRIVWAIYSDFPVQPIYAGGQRKDIRRRRLVGWRLVA